MQELWLPRVRKRRLILRNKRLSLCHLSVCVLLLSHNYHLSNFVEFTRFARQLVLVLSADEGGPLLGSPGSKLGRVRPLGLRAGLDVAAVRLSRGHGANGAGTQLHLR